MVSFLLLGWTVPKMIKTPNSGDVTYIGVYIYECFAIVWSFCGMEHYFDLLWWVKCTRTPVACLVFSQCAM